MDITVNYLAVLVAAVAGFVVGFLWHGPLFGKVWMSLSGITEAQAKEAMAKGGMGPSYAMAFIAQLVTAFVIAHFLQLLSMTDINGALQLAFWAWLGFIVPVALNGVLWEGKSVKLYLFNIVYLLVLLVVLSMVLVSWPS